MRKPLLPKWVNIGRSHLPDKRAKQLSASQPFKISVKRTFAEKGYLEKTIHDKLKKIRIKHGPGMEWFELGVDEASILIEAAIIQERIDEMDPNPEFQWKNYMHSD